MDIGTTISDTCWIPRDVFNNLKAINPSTEPHRTDADMIEDENDNTDSFFPTTEGELEQAENDPNLRSGDSEDDISIHQTDCIFVAASSKADAFTLETYIYDENNESLFVYESIMVDDVPLCVELLDFDDKCCIAVGTFQPVIELWDIMDPTSPTPVLKLGGNDKGHQGSVMCMQRNKLQKNFMASGSEDTHIHIWDISTSSVAQTVKTHEDKIQCVSYHPCESNVLLSAAFDKKVALTDLREPSDQVSINLTTDPEALIWSRHAPFQFMVADESGHVSAFDVRWVKTSKSALWHLPAHTKACTGISECLINGLMCTTSLDGEAKIWRYSGETSPSILSQKDMNTGPLFCISDCPDEKTLFSIGSTKVVLWDILEMEAVRNL